MKTYLYILLFFLSGVMIACNRKQATPQLEDPAIAVKTICADYILYQDMVHSAGKLASREEIKLSFKTGGIVSALSVKEGDYVKKGTAMAKLNLAEIQAGARQAKLAVDKSYRDLLRAKNLYRDSVATLEQLQNARTAYDLARAQKEIADFNLKYSVITAPSDGKVLKILTSVNEMIAPGYPAILFASAGEEWVINCALTDKDAIRMTLGDSASVRMDAYPDSVFSASVSEIAAIADPYTGTYETEILLESSVPGFRSGLIASVDIYSSSRDSMIWLPLLSLLEPVDNTASVYIVAEGKTLRRRIGIYRIYNEGVLVKDGISVGETVITEGASLVTTDSRIKPVN